MIVWFLLLHLLPLAIFSQREKSAKKHVLSFLKAVLSTSGLGKISETLLGSFFSSCLMLVTHFSLWSKLFCIRSSSDILTWSWCQPYFIVIYFFTILIRVHFVGLSRELVIVVGFYKFSEHIDKYLLSTCWCLWYGHRRRTLKEYNKFVVQLQTNAST